MSANIRQNHGLIHGSGGSAAIDNSATYVALIEDGSNNDHFDTASGRNQGILSDLTQGQLIISQSGIYHVRGVVTMELSATGDGLDIALGVNGVAQTVDAAVHRLLGKGGVSPGSPITAVVDGLLELQEKDYLQIMQKEVATGDDGTVRGISLLAFGIA